MVRRVVPFGPPAALVALLVGWAVGGAGTGWSASIGVAVVTLNALASGLSVRRAARVSVNALFAVSAIGVFVRLAVIVALLFLLDRFAFFSPSAFALAVVPATVLLLVFEMKVFAGPLGRELVLPPRDEEKVAP